MKNSYKRLIALLGVLLMLFAFVACTQTKPEISIDGNKQRSLTCGEKLQFSATAKGGDVGWAIDGKTLGCTLSESGLFTAGQEVGKVTVKAYIVGNESVFDTASVTVSAKSEDKPTIQIDGATTRETYCGYTVQLSATATGGNITLAEYKKLIATIVNALRAKNPDIVITLFTVPPFNYSGTQGNTWFAMNDWIRQRNVNGVDKYFDFAAVLSQDAPNENYLINRYMSSGTDAHPNGIAGEDVVGSFLNWYNGKSDSVAEVYESHINVDLNQDYTLPSFVKVRTEGGFFRYAAVEWGKQATTESVGTTVYEGNVDGTNQKAYLTLRVRNTSATNFVYEVHCANSLATADDSLVNSVYDKVFGADPTTGKQWGYVNDGEYATGQFWENNADNIMVASIKIVQA